MDWKLAACIVVMFIGLLGTLFPLLPGIPLIFLAMLGFDWANGFTILGPYFLLAMFLLTALSVAADYFSGVIGAHKYGASSPGKVGALLGGILGLFFLPLGIIVGPLLGVFIGEMIAGRTPEQAVRGGFGVLIGIVAGTVARVVIGLIMVSAFMLRLFL
ncbi:MAG: DUF456 domain-containing protein [Firmicutes bacterium]|nr:DUF456 domain-containing protein [Bacillota bacterium]